MTDKRPPMPNRDRGFSTTLNNPEDGTPISEMVKVDGKLLIVSEKCTYQTQLADQVDPGRTNPSLPPVVQQKLFDYGANSDLLRRSLLHARVMFRNEFQKIDNDAAMSLSFKATANLIALRDLANAFVVRENGAIAKSEALEIKDRSLTLPATGGVLEDFKSFCQKADHLSHDLLEIVRLFYPEMKKQRWANFPDVVRAKDGDGDQFYGILQSIVPMLQMLKDARYCLDHHLSGVTVADFKANPDGTISRPSVEIDFRKSKQPQVDISYFMDQLATSLLATFEMVVVHLCAKNMQSFANMPFVVGKTEPSSQVPGRWAYGMIYDGGRFVPCG